jgi:predicted HTH domain antitoxin
LTLVLQTPTQELTLHVPEDLSASQRERLAVALYDARMVSQGRAAEIAGVSRSEFLDALGRHGVTPFQYSAEEAIAEAARV